MMFLRRCGAQVLGFLLEKLLQSLGLQTSTRVFIQRRELHRIARLVVTQRVVEDETDEQEEVCAAVDLSVL